LSFTRGTTQLGSRPINRLPTFRQRLPEAWPHATIGGPCNGRRPVLTTEGAARQARFPNTARKGTSAAFHWASVTVYALASLAVFRRLLSFVFASDFYCVRPVSGRQIQCLLFTYRIALIIGKKRWMSRLASRTFINLHW